MTTKILDPSTKHGCFCVGEDKSILSAGYNSPPKGSIDQNIPLTRPEKYIFMEHSERNSIYNAAKHGIKIDGSTFYITGRCCSECLRAMINSGAKKDCLWSTEFNLCF